jgi:hypothetical protein
METAVRGSGTIWLWTDETLIVTASPTVVCVWVDQRSVNETIGLMAGPFVPEPRIRTEQDLIDWYNQWLADGGPK